MKFSSFSLLGKYEIPVFAPGPKERRAPLQLAPQSSPDTKEKDSLCVLASEIRQKWWPTYWLQAP